MHPLIGFYRWYRDTLRHSPYRWLLLLGSLVYLLSPIDFAPDAFPLFGWIDEGILMAIFNREPQPKPPASPQGTVVDGTAQEVNEDSSS